MFVLRYVYVDFVVIEKEKQDIASCDILLVVLAFV